MECARSQVVCVHRAEQEPESMVLEAGRQVVLREGFLFCGGKRGTLRAGLGRWALGLHNETHGIVRLR